MKTAMQELIELLVSRMDSADDELKNKLDFFHSWAVVHGLEKEKQQIIDAAVYGNGRAAVEDKKYFGEHYYTQTFTPSLNH